MKLSKFRSDSSLHVTLGSLLIGKHLKWLKLQINYDFRNAIECINTLFVGRSESFSSTQPATNVLRALPAHIPCRASYEIISAISFSSASILVDTCEFVRLGIGNQNLLQVSMGENISHLPRLPFSIYISYRHNS